jgi:hypothetical protein
VRVDDVARTCLNLAGDRVDPAVFDLRAPSAALADDVVMVGRLANDVRVLTVRKVKALDETELLEQLQSSEDGRATDTQAASFRLAHEVERSEMVPSLSDHLGYHAPRLGDVIAGFVQCVRQRKRITHGAK